MALLMALISGADLSRWMAGLMKGDGSAELITSCRAPAGLGQFRHPWLRIGQFAAAPFMTRLLRWGLGLALIGLLLVGAFLVLPFRAWLPGGTVADVPKSEVVNGTAFNRLFPAPQAGEAIVFTQEKRGFSEARLKQGDQTVALLAISDTTTAPEARDKFSQTSERLQGWPLLEQGAQASALLVAERFQVKVIGQGPGLAADQRHDLLNGFDLKGLAALQTKTAAAKSLRAGSSPALRSVPEATGRSNADQPAEFEPAAFQPATFLPSDYLSSDSIAAAFQPTVATAAVPGQYTMGSPTLARTALELAR
jgi:hypothetical protein